MKAKEIFDKFKKLKVLVVGDVMLDKYYVGTTDRISPEAPVPVVNVTKTEMRLGGAANVALNIKELGAEPILVSILGKDVAGKDLLNILSKSKIDSNYLLASDKRITTVKTRVVSHNHQLLRFDEEMSDDISSAESDKLLELLNVAIQKHKPDIVIYEDYNKGMLSKEFINASLKLFLKNKIPIAVDPKKKNFFEFKNVTLFKPNLREVNEALNTDAGSELKSLNKIAEILRERMNFEILMITLSDKGVFYHDRKKGFILSAHVRNISDVSGAGDTVIAVAALGLSAKLLLNDVMELANLAGGIVCEEAGVVPVRKEKLMSELKN